MPKKRLLLVAGSPLRGKFFFLTASLVLLFFIYPFVQTAAGFRFLDVFLSVVLLASIYAVYHQRRMLLIAVALAAPALMATWGAHLTGQLPMLLLVGQGLMDIFFLFTTISILSDVLRDEVVTVDKIFGAICVYLMIGLIWALLFSLLDSLEPGAINMDALNPGGARLEPHLRTEFSQYIYLSFVTLTTLGYGDVVPVSQIARSLAFMEAVLGQLYLTILVARLVGLHIARHRDL